MASKLENSVVNPNEELIDLAYSMAIEPHRYKALAKIIDTRLHDAHSSHQNHSINEVTDHFQRAFTLLERQGRHSNVSTGSMRYINADSRPSILVREDGVIFHANKSALSSLKIKIEQKINADNFEYGEYDCLLQDIKTLKKHKINTVISVYNMVLADGNSQIKMALFRAIDYTGKSIGRLCTFHIKWIPEMGRQFQESFNLKPVEMAIVKTIVTGGNLNGLANERGRSLATIRTQAKTLMSRLSVHSQVELACLYSGFTQSNRHSPLLEEVPQTHIDENWREKFILPLPNNRNLHYEIVGPKKGRPVLFFHALIGGTILTQSMRDDIEKRNIRLIMVWRPFFAQTSADGVHRGAPARFARDIEYLLDHLKVENCQILAVISGAIYAYACAQSMPKKISSIVSCGGCIPIATKEQFNQMGANSRVAIYLARYAPQLLPMLLRAMLSSIDSGYDYELVQSLYDNSPNDQNVFFDEEIASLVQNSFPTTVMQGYKPFARDIHMQARKWGHLLDGVTCKVALIHGDRDPAYPMNTVHAFIKDRENFKVLPISNAGQLVYLKHPNLAFAALDELEEQCGAHYIGDHKSP